MSRRFRILLAVATLITFATTPARAQSAETNAPSEPVQFKAAGGATTYGVFYAAKNSAQPMILLFHQAGSNHYEYARIAPELSAAGFPCLAIDQRWGGDMWGQTNETAQKLAHPKTGPGELTDLEADLNAAWDWARKKHPGRRIILWGSSYSASLVFVLAAEHPQETAAVLAFSPGEYFQQHPGLVREAAAKVRAPVFVTSENDAEALADATRIFEAVPSRDKVHYRAQFAVHGSSTLRTDRNPKGAAANWRAVMNFLRQFEE